MNFYLSKDGQQLGPYSVGQIQMLLKQGMAAADDQVWAEGWPSWMPIRVVPGFTHTDPQFPRASSATEAAFTPPSEPQPSIKHESLPQYAENKNPILACILSLAIVGLGQFYNGDWGKGWFLLITCILATLFSFGMLWVFWALMSAVDAYLVAAQKRPLRGSFFKF